MLAQPTTAPGLLPHTAVSPSAPMPSFAMRDLPLALLLRLVPQAALRKVQQGLPHLVNGTVPAKTPLYVEAEVSSPTCVTTPTLNDSNPTELEPVYSSSEAPPVPVATPKRTRSAGAGEFMMSPFIPDAESTPAYVVDKDATEVPPISQKLLGLIERTTLNPRAVTFTPSTPPLGRTSSASPADSGEPLLSARNPLSTYCRLTSPFADRHWWECVTMEGARNPERDAHTTSLGAAANILM